MAQEFPPHSQIHSPAKRLAPQLFTSHMSSLSWSSSGLLKDLLFHFLHGHGIKSRS